MSALVVAAAQSPTLLNILAQSSRWRLAVVSLGDHQRLAEMRELTVPQWRREMGEPDIVLVCSPAHHDAVASTWPKAKIAWVIHNGRERHLLPVDFEDRVDAIVVFSDLLRWICGAGRRAPCFMLSPAYEPSPSWSWAPEPLWTLCNRPSSRDDDRASVIAAITDGFGHRYYGQGQKHGYAGGHARDSLRARSTAYVSALHRTAGFGLAEHEAMAAGVPIVGGWWGDMEAEVPSYWGLQHSLWEMRRALGRVVLDEAAAMELSALGLDYIRRCRTRERMDATIDNLISGMSGGPRAIDL